MKLNHPVSWWLILLRIRSLNDQCSNEPLWHYCVWCRLVGSFHRAYCLCWVWMSYTWIALHSMHRNGQRLPTHAYLWRINHTSKVTSWLAVQFSATIRPSQALWAQAPGVLGHPKKVSLHCTDVLGFSDRVRPSGVRPSTKKWNRRSRVIHHSMLAVYNEIDVLTVAV